ncbi:MAG: hypothetical protein U9P79_05425 [Candidatus Cloacimonadota bacterium]|nr:hypothetical protein [Candidatus Cloacimonadota bacterium]
MNEKKYLLLFISVLFILSGCANTTSNNGQAEPQTVAVQEIQLAGPISHRDAEISGLVWFGNYLILLPQYPDRFAGESDGKLFSIERNIISEYVNHVDRTPITPEEFEFFAPGLKDSIPGYEGFEAIGIWGNKIFLTIEASPDSMRGYLISGEINGAENIITMDMSSLAQIPLQQQIPNASDETVLVTQDRVITIFEGNGMNINPSPIAHVFDHNLQLLENIPFPHIEYRITDATDLNGENKFWAINYYYPGDKKTYKPNFPQSKDTKKLHNLKTNTPVEQFIQLQYTGNSIELTELEPIELQLLPSGDARNWEGIVRLNETGFLIATDKYPQTIFGFVEKP